MGTQRFLRRFLTRRFLTRKTINEVPHVNTIHTRKPPTKMIYSKRSFSHFMALTCLLGMASAGYNPSSDEKWDSDLEYRNNLRRVKSDPNMFEHGHLRLGRGDSAQS